MDDEIQECKSVLQSLAEGAVSGIVISVIVYSAVLILKMYFEVQLW